MLSLKLLGSLEVKQGNSNVALPQSLKSRALLGYLAVAGNACTRDDLCHLFWEIPDDPRGALRWSLSKLRLVVNTDTCSPLCADRHSVRLDCDLIDVDLNFVRNTANSNHADSEILCRAWHLADKGLLVDCDLPNLSQYTDWLTQQRANLLVLKAKLAKRLADDASLPQEKRQFWLNHWQKDSSSTLASPLHSATTPAQPHQDVRFVRAHDGVNIAWAGVGDTNAPTIIKAANWLTHLELDWQAPIWSPLFHDLAQDHHIVRYDERGCGLSDWDVPEISFATFVTDLEKVVEATGVEKFALLGISQGAAVSIEYAARYPERVSKLILFGGYPVGWRPIASEQEKKEREAVMVLTQSGWGRPDPTYRRLFSQTFMPEASKEELDWFDEFQRRTTSPQNATRFLQAFSTIDVREQLHRLNVPTLVLHSRGDRRIPHATGRDLAAQIKGARLTTLESNSHLLIGREPAAQTFVTAVRDFLREPQ